jgi:hypothetical protein
LSIDYNLGVESQSWLCSLMVVCIVLVLCVCVYVGCVVLFARFGKQISSDTIYAL